MIDDVTGNDFGENVIVFFDDDTSTLPEVFDNGTGPVAISRAPSLTAIATEPTDPVTVWAMAETSYRKSAAGKMGRIRWAATPWFPHRLPPHQIPSKSLIGRWRKPLVGNSPPPPPGRLNRVPGQPPSLGCFRFRPPGARKQRPLPRPRLRPPFALSTPWRRYART